jgi:cyanate permease
MFLGAAAANGTIAHVVPLLTDRGIPPAEALTTLALVGVSSMAGRLVGGVLLDRFWAPLVALLFFAGMVAGITLLAVGPTLVLSKVAVVLLGLGLGVEADLAGFLISRYLGLKAFGALFGIIFGAFLIASSLAPVLMGVLFDLTGAYTICLVIFAGFSFVAATTLLALGPYTYPLRRADSSNLA